MNDLFEALVFLDPADGQNEIFSVEAKGPEKFGIDPRIVHVREHAVSLIDIFPGII